MVDYTSVYNESKNEAVKIIKTLGKREAPDVHTLATYVFKDKLDRIRMQEEVSVIALGLNLIRNEIKAAGSIQTPGYLADRDTPIVPVDQTIVDETTERERAQIFLRAEKERLDRLDREFEEAFGKTNI